MPHNKHLKWDQNSGKDAADDSIPEDATLPRAQPAANDADGWQQYRRWVSKAPAPKGRRVGIDPALYSWKNYRNWSDNVKRNWIKDTDED